MSESSRPRVLQKFPFENIEGCKIPDSLAMIHPTDLPVSRPAREPANKLSCDWTEVVELEGLS